MKQNINAWLEPTIEEPELARRQYMLNIILVALAIPGFLFGLVSAAIWALGGPPNAGIGALAGVGVQIFYLLAYWLGRRGKLNLASSIPVMTLFLIMSGSSYQMGIGHVTLIGYAMTAVAASILLGAVPAALLTLLITVTYMLIGWGQAAGRIPSAIPPEATIGADAAGLGFGLIVLVIFNEFYSHEMNKALHRQEEVSAELKAHREKLEQRVTKRTWDLERRARELETAAEVARDAVAIQDVGKLISETVKLISERFGFYHAAIFLLDQTGKYAILEAASSEGGRRMLERGHRLEVGEKGIVGHTAEMGKPRIALDVGQDAAFLSNPYLPATQSEMGLPLKVRDRVIGVLDVQSKEPRAFSNEDVSILQTLADQVALAIHNARLLEETEERIAEISKLLGRERLASWEQLLGEGEGWGYVYDGIDAEKIADLKVIDSQVADARSQIVEEGHLTVPLRVRGEPIGRLNLALEDRSLTSNDVALAQAVVDQASQALESARLFQETQRALGETEALYRAGQDIAAATDPGEVLRAITNHVVKPQIDRCALAILDPNSPPENPIVEIEAAWEPGVQDPEVLGNRWSISQIPLIAKMITEPSIISDVTTSPALDDVSRHVFTNVLDIQAVAIIPLLIGKRNLGWMLVESLNEPYEFSEREIRLYRTLSDQAAIALEGMRLLEETRRRAERERLTAEITTRVRASTEIDTILRTALGDLGRSLRASEGVIQLGDGAEKSSK